MDPVFFHDFEKALQSAYEKYVTSGPVNLSQSIHYSLFAPGKRIRPRIALATSEVVGLEKSAALSIAVSLEMAHCFTLIHDDLPCLDNDDFRRGRPSNHKAHGEGLALLAGDALLSTSLRALLDAPVSAKGLARGVKRMLDSIGPTGVIGGQCAEMLLDALSTIEDLKQMHQGKTGALFLASVLLPAEFAEIPLGDEKFHALEELGRAMGQAFQIIDDLEDSKQDETREPTNISSYLTAAQAKSMGASALEKSIQNVQMAWPSSVQSLLSIAGGILEQLT